MILQTDLLYRFARAHGRNDSRPDDVSVEVPPSLIPIIEVPGPLTNTTNVAGTVTQRESFVFNSTRLLAASAAQTDDDLVLFGAGLWRIDVRMTHHTDLTQAPSVNGASLVLTLDGVGITLARFPSIANLDQERVLSLKSLFAVDGFGLRLTTGATVAAQNRFTSLAGICHRLN